MKVAVVVNCLEMGGMERVAVNLADAFAKEGHQSHLIYLKNRKIEVSPQQSSVNLHLFNLSKVVLMTGVGFLWLIICKLLNILFRKTFPIFFAYAESFVFRYKLKQLEKKSGRFDLIVFRGQGTFAHIWPLRDPRFVFVCESVQHKFMYKGLSRWVFNSLFSKRKVVCVSNGAKQSFLNLATEHNIQCESVDTITNPNDLNMIVDKSKQKVDGIPDSYILGLGRLVSLKNFPLLVRAYHLARLDHGVTLPLVIVGEGKDRPNIENVVSELQLDEHVYFQGQQDNPYPWFRGAEVFVLSSQLEGLGMVLIEALICGCKLVATDCPGGVSDIMQGDLESYRVGQTPEALSEAMVRALTLDHPQINHQQKNKILSAFSDDVIVQRYIKKFSS